MAQPPPEGRLSKRVKIVISLIVVSSGVLGPVLVFYFSHPYISSVQVLNYEVKWTGDEVNIDNPTPAELLDPEYSLNPYIALTIKNPTQYQVFIKMYGLVDMTIIKNGQKVGDFENADGTQTFSLSPRSEDVYALTLQSYPSGYTYLESDNMTVPFSCWTFQEIYRGTTSRE